MKGKAKIVTFYSYKGGVGRTQLCANLASYLYYKENKNVLLWDWDFEAPGLHHYFGKKTEEINQDGTLEFIEAFLKNTRAGQAVARAELKLIGPEDTINLHTNRASKRLDLMPAGNYSKHFLSRFNKLDWFEFSILNNGINFLELIRRNLEDSIYDYIFIDSSSGINDYSGICNVLLPDLNIVVITPNDQSFAGSKAIIQHIRNHSYTREKRMTSEKSISIMPILSRLDENHEDAKTWISKFTKEFSFLFPDIIHMDRDKPAGREQNELSKFFVIKTFIPYIYSISAGENLFFVNAQDEIDYSPLERRFKIIAECIEQLKSDRLIDLKNLPSLGSEIDNLQIDKLMENAREFISLGLFESAIQAINQAMEIAPQHPNIWRSLGDVRTEQRQFEKALNCYKQALAKDREKTEIFERIAYVYELMNDFKNARNYYKKARRLNPAASDIKGYEAFTFYVLGEDERGRALFREFQQEASEKSNLKLEHLNNRPVDQSLNTDPHNLTNG